jgi:hypothetical protein
MHGLLKLVPYVSLLACGALACAPQASRET